MLAELKYKVLIVVLLLAITWLALVSYRGWQKRTELKEELAILERNKAELRARNQDIQTQLEQLEDPAFLEKEARQKFNYQREGETAVIFVKSATSNNEEVDESTETASIFTKFMNWFRLLFD